MSDSASGQPTLAQVARLAGVSIKTASRVLNGERYVAAPTSEKVHQAAGMLGFRPNRMASELRRKTRSTLIGMVTGNLGNPFYGDIASVLERRLRPAGYQLITASSDDPQTESRLVEELLERRVAAVIVVSSTGAQRYSQTAGHAPVVYLDRPRIGAGGDSVVIDDRGGARMAVRHLIQHGHKRIAIIGDRGQQPTYQERLLGFTEALTEAGLTTWESYVRDDVHSSRTAKNVVAGVMSQGLTPDALLTTGSRMTIGAINAFQRLNRSAALVGFDDFELADVLRVSVIKHKVSRLASEGAELVLSRLAGNDPPPRPVVIPCRLVDRGSGLRYLLV
jgi:LacI family transcriptional regulator